MKNFSKILLALLAFSAPARADQVNVAVAANFTGALQRLGTEFERATGHRLVSSFGATGKLYAQIVNGAPFDALLAADDRTPRRLEQEGVGVPGTRFTYAVGQIVLWSPTPGAVDERGEVLKTGDFAHLAIANPKTAPYGAAAEQALRRSETWNRVASRLVYGENIAQTFQFVNSGNAALGFVALAQVRALTESQRGSQWLVPATLYDPLRQDALLLKRGANNKGARAFLEFLRSARARAVIEELGYSTTQDGK